MTYASGDHLSRQTIRYDIDAELNRAYAKHGKEKWGRHEFYAILLEEVDELWDAIKTDRPLTEVHTEAIQVAAVVIRWLETGERYDFISKDWEPGHYIQEG
jgi:NTP pyrophosphatase (non-canonical NTP hydrolase)